LVRTHGRPRALLRADVADEAVWRRSDVDGLLLESGIRDRLVAGAPLAAGTELLLVAYRRTAAPPFGATERDALASLMANLRDVGRTVARAYGLVDAWAPLVGRERQVLQLLLHGLSESEVAARLGLTARSVHQYVVAIHHKLGVRSRGELIAHFLSPRMREAALARFTSYLNRREIEVLCGLASGRSEKEIADIVSLSSRAVHHVVAAIYRKTGAHTRGALLARMLAAVP
jgi:DNA-binding NarL/FixJ family response regulator